MNHKISEKMKLFRLCFYISIKSRYMTNRLRMRDDEEEIVSDWKFAAMVIDRQDIIFYNVTYMTK